MSVYVYIIYICVSVSARDKGYNVNKCNREKETEGIIIK